ncbi:MAG TPA: ABC transporter permease [Gaiellaceae bacterium]|jgi:simple sugar transport system permease protein|nr:ABC transporter permease [Gaiellaceae bacterium]
MTEGPEAAPGAGFSGLTAFYERAGGFIVPLAATVLAFIIGGLVVAVTGHNPFTAYRAIFNGTGLNWFFPWVQGTDRTHAAVNLEQTLIVMTPLMLTALAVAFAFRCGLFNIGGQGQYWVGFIAAIWIGTHMAGLTRPAHVLVALLAAIVAGAIWGGIAGLLKATVGAHEVISTIMLNWIAIYGGQYLFELNGPLQGPVPALPRSSVIDNSAKLWPIWKMEGVIQVLHAGIFIALFALLVYYVLLNRTTLGYEVRAVGFNPEAARYGGISVAKNYFLALAIAGSFAGLAGGVDLLGYKFAVDTSDFATNQVGFTGIAVALLGRNKAVGILFAALLFASLQTGTSTRALDPSIFSPSLATDLATIIQALVIFFVGAEVLIFYIWRARRYVRVRTASAPEAQL